MGIIKKIFGKKEQTESEFKADVLKKATEHMNANSESAASADDVKTRVVEKSFTGYEDIDQVKKKNIRIVLLEIADRGEAGVLATSISDKAGMNKHDAATALSFLTSKNYIEAVNSTSGMKYYLTGAGRKHCLSKEFNSII